MAKKASTLKESDEIVDSPTPDVSVEEAKEENPTGSPTSDLSVEEAKEQSPTDSIGSDASEPVIPFTICIPFLASASIGRELQYALRAWDQHFPGIRIAIIGDLPDWAVLSDRLIHIPHTPTSRNPQIDVASKMMAAIQSSLIPEYFGWSNDDIYPVAPVTLTDIDVHTAKGTLGQRGSAGSTYRANAARTLAALQAAGIKAPFDYATHTPVGFHKSELAEVIDQFRCLEEGHLVSTLYFNVVWKGHRPIIVDIGAHPHSPGTQSYIGSVFTKADPKRLAQAFSERKFINNNDAGWPSVEPFLAKFFSSPSSFEK